ncbi:MAG TPA: glycoside hydrolase family 2 TIM barrel-domain containing protein [Candidatus Limnocylindrales bacterium]|nr:glycoside hydrolase family 2 TIM barrel-domain containing protein [Candidatus Limnocylindrales bacterium]
MTRDIPVDAGWRLKGYLGEDAAVEAVRSGGTGPGWVPASVPGSVAWDLVVAGEVGDPYRERATLGLEWIAARAWRYAVSVEVPPLDDDDRVFLRFEGVDHAASAWWDGAEVARHEGMFTPFEVRLGGPAASPGAHRLDVVVAPAPDSEPQQGRTSRVRVHKSRMTYGWDFCPRLVHQGIWRPVTLEVRCGARLLGTTARTALAEDHAAARVTLGVDVERWSERRLELRIALADGERAVASAVVDVAPLEPRSRTTVTLDVADPALWWPNGHGEAAVHDLRTCLIDAGTGEVLDEIVQPLGIREVRLEPNEGAPDDARGYTFVVNGRRIYATGWNWVPVDVFHGVPRPEAEAHLLRLARDAHVVLLRVWGGGIVESTSFYDACDRLGIMVWQELAQSSSGAESTPAADDEFVQRMVAETRVIIASRRDHPSLALWCGGNELADASGPLDEARSPVLAALREVVAAEDPDRPWLPTSPTGPRFHNRLEDIEAAPDDLHDVHGPWEHQGLLGQAVLYDRGTSLLNSEFGVEGMANRRTLEALIAPGHRWPATRENPVYRHLGDWWNNEPLVQASFGGGIEDLDTLRRASQHLQADGLRYAVEANRRREPRQSGSLPWQLNESYPNAWCTAAVDHRGDPKPAYFAVRRAYSPVHACARFAGWATHGRRLEAEVWAWSALADGEAVVRGGFRGLDGEPLGRPLQTSVRLGAGRPVALGRVTARAPRDLAILDLAIELDGARPQVNRYVLSTGRDLAALRSIEPATLELDRTADEDDPGLQALSLRHVAGPAALGLVIEDARPIAAPGWLEAEDGWFDLLPGESRRLGLRWADAPPEERRIRLHGWNVDVELG